MFEIKKLIIGIVASILFISNTSYINACFIYTKNNVDYSQSKDIDTYEILYSELEKVDKYLGKDSKEGVLGLQRTALVEASLNMFDVTKNTIYLDRATEQLDDMLDLRASVTGECDYKSEIKPAWVYKTSTGQLVYSILHAARVSIVLTRFSLTVEKNNLEKYKGKSNIYIEASLNAMEAFEEIYDAQYGAYRWETDFPTNEDFAKGCMITTNQNISAALAWAYLGEYYRNNKYIDRFEGFLRIFKEGVIDNKKLDGKTGRICPGIETRISDMGQYYWWYYDPFLPVKNRISEDVLHAFWVIEACVYDATVTKRIFNDEDLYKFGNTIDRFIINGDHITPKLNKYLDMDSYKETYINFYRSYARLAFIPRLDSKYIQSYDKVKEVARYYLQDIIEFNLRNDEGINKIEQSRTNYFGSLPFALNYLSYSIMYEQR